MSSPKAPKQPDVIGAAREQGQQNILAAQTQAQLNRVNQSGPAGTVRYSQDPNNPNIYTQTTELSPEQQRLYDANVQGQQQRVNQGNQAFQMYGGNIGRGIDTGGLPQRQYTANPTDQTSTVNANSLRYGDINTNGLRGFESGGPAARYQRGVDFSSATQLPGNNDFSAERQRVEDALYGRAASRLDDQFARREEDQRAQLLNRGLREGTEAYANAERDLNQSRTDAYGDLRDRAVLAGGQEQSRLFQQALAARQQGVGEQLQQGQFANDAAQLQNMYGLNRRQQAATERGQQFSEAQNVAQFGNQAAQQNFSNELARGQFQNEAQQQEFQQRLANAMLANQQRDAGINEQVTNQNQQLQGLGYLYGGGGADVPQSLAPGGSGTVAPTDIYGATQDAYQNQLGVYGQRSQQAAQQQALLAQLIGAGALAFSDRRLKTDIKAVGQTPSGDLSIYRYRYKGSTEPQLGVMADEVRRVYPEAVVPTSSGYDMVDYGRVFAREVEGG